MVATSNLSFAAARNLVNGGSLAEPIDGAAEALYLRLRQLQPFLDLQNLEQPQPPSELAQGIVKIATFDALIRRFPQR